MAENIQDVIKESSGYGGARAGAGRPKGVVHADKWFAARGINPLMAGEILHRATNELKAWQRIFSSPDDMIVLKALMYLTDRRDGKAHQSVHITSNNLNVTCDISQIENARAIAREITGMLSQSSTVASAPTEGDAAEEIRNAPSNGDVTIQSGLTSELRPMLPAVGGAEKGGR